MSIESPSIPAASAQPKKKNCLLWGCLSFIALIAVTLCCVGSLVVLPFVTDFDPFNLRNRLEEIIHLGDYIDDPSQFPGFEDFLGDDFDFEQDDFFDSEDSDPGSFDDASSIPMSYYSAGDFPANFLYPSGWGIEAEDKAVTFYDPTSYTYLYVGEDLVDEGITPADIADDVLESLKEESQEGTFQLITSEPWQVPTGEDAWLYQMEWTDLEGYDIWAYDLEIVSGESNVFFFLSGEKPADIDLYGDLLRIIVDSYTRD